MTIRNDLKASLTTKFHNKSHRSPSNLSLKIQSNIKADAYRKIPAGLLLQQAIQSERTSQLVSKENTTTNVCLSLGLRTQLQHSVSSIRRVNEDENLADAKTNRACLPLIHHRPARIHPDTWSVNPIDHFHISC